jgi:hypothetical protein
MPRKGLLLRQSFLLGEDDIQNGLALFGIAVANDFIALGPRGTAKADPFGEVFDHAEQFHAVFHHQLVVGLKHTRDLGALIFHSFLAGADQGVALLLGQALEPAFSGDEVGAEHGVDDNG